MGTKVEVAKELDMVTTIESSLNIPEGLIVFISGVPGTGKTTISYELLKRCEKFRIIQETDLIREILRGYNEYLDSMAGDAAIINAMHEKISIPDHTKIFNYKELMEQCSIMKRPIEKIVMRQQRKGISSIINGVHIVPEILNGIAQNRRVIYINLYINTKNVLKSRLSTRNQQKYMPYLDVSFDANCDLYDSVLVLSQKHPNIFKNIDVTYLSIEDAVNEAINFIRMK